MCSTRAQPTSRFASLILTKTPGAFKVGSESGVGAFQNIGLVKYLGKKISFLLGYQTLCKNRDREMFVQMYFSIWILLW